MADPGNCGVLFDLDGTFADTAPDLAHALNRVLEAHGRPRRSLEQIRPHVSHGGKALIRFGFGLEPAEADFEALRQELLTLYRADIVTRTRLFPGMDELVKTLERRAIPWGIVTNKPAWLTEPLMEGLGMTGRAACIVSGDTTANPKPHPEPILRACRLIGRPAAHCWYLGDAQRDIDAGRNAGSRTLVALFGYLGDGDRPESWGADAMIRRPMELLDLLED